MTENGVTLQWRELCCKLVETIASNIKRLDPRPFRVSTCPAAAVNFRRAMAAVIRWVRLRRSIFKNERTWRVERGSVVLTKIFNVCRILAVPIRR